MISYKKRSGTTVVEIQLKGSFEPREIAAIFQNSANYCYDITGVIGYVVDCRQLDFAYDVAEKKRILQSIFEILKEHVVRIGLVYNEEQRQKISYGILHSINASRQFHIAVVKDPESAYLWLDTEIETFALWEREEELRREAERKAALQSAPKKESAIEVNPHEVFILENASPFVHPDAAPKWNPSIEAEQNRQVNHKLRDSKTSDVHQTYVADVATTHQEQSASVEENRSYDHYFLSEENMKSTP